VFRGFCTRCGSAIHYRPVEDREIHLYLGVFDDPARYRTNGHTFYNEHIEGYEFSDNLPRFGPSGKQPIAWGREATRNLLFLCTGNSARSIMAEAIANRRTLGGIRAFSAGSRPSATVDAAAIAELERRDYATDHLHSKSWDLFVGADAPQLEWVITLCDRAAAENCPAFAGDYERDHWSIPDPAGNPAACAEVFQSLDERITAFMRFRASAAHRGT
jgi:protein-tyrosine-phosphatase